MSKRKPTKVSKQAHGNVAVKGRRIAAEATKPSREHKAATPQKTASKSNQMLKKPMGSLPVVESPAIASQNESQRSTTRDGTKSVDVFPAPKELGTKTEPPEMLQSIQLAYEFANKVMQIRSPFELPQVCFEFTIKQFAMFQDLVFPPKKSH